MKFFGVKKSEGVGGGAKIYSVDCQQVSESAAAFNEVEVCNPQQKNLTPTSFSAHKRIKRFYNKNNFEITLFLNRIQNIFEIWNIFDLNLLLHENL